MKRTPITTDPERVRAFIDRGRRASAESLNRPMPHDLEERPAPKRTLPRSQPRRDWSDARAKVERQAVCRVGDDLSCSGQLEAAHVIGRDRDRPKTERSTTLYVHPDAIVPLCQRHHKLYDEPGPRDEPLDLLPYLTLAEQLRAVEDADGLELARRRTCPTEYRRQEAA